MNLSTFFCFECEYKNLRRPLTISFSCFYSFCVHYGRFFGLFSLAFTPVSRSCNFSNNLFCSETNPSKNDCLNPSSFSRTMKSIASSRFWGFFLLSSSLNASSAANLSASAFAAASWSAFSLASNASFMA